MKKRMIYFFLLLTTTTFFTSCSKDEVNNNKTDSFYEKEKKRTEILENNDMVLLYAGGAHRSYDWNEELIEPYVTYVDETGKEHWMFDSFLFLEIHNGEGKSFATGYTETPANKEDWKKLVNHYFQPQHRLGALDKSIENAIKRIGEPTEKRKVVIGIPEPISNQRDWGSIETGFMLNFSKDKDKVDAVKWYIDYVRTKFNIFNYKNIELAGFYWIHEAAYGGSRSITPLISAYLNNLKYSFIWIPYYNAPGAFEWKQMKFNYAYYQPNYFFSEDRPISRLKDACDNAIKYDMDMEIEFDDRALAKHGWGYRLENYMNAFKEYGIWENKRIAYYQGGTTLYKLSKSTIQEEKELYHKFCKFVIERPNKYRFNHVH